MKALILHQKDPSLKSNNLRYIFYFQERGLPPKDLLPREEEDLKLLFSTLKRQREGLEHLCRILEKDKRDLSLMKRKND